MKLNICLDEIINQICSRPRIDFFYPFKKKEHYTTNQVRNRQNGLCQPTDNEKCLPKHFQTFSDKLVPSATVVNSHFLFFKKTRFNFTPSHKCGQSIVYFFHVCCMYASVKHSKFERKKKLLHGQRFCKTEVFVIRNSYNFSWIAFCVKFWFFWPRIETLN